MIRFKKFYLSEAFGSNHPPHKPERDLKKVISKYKIPDDLGYDKVYYGPTSIYIPLPELSMLKIGSGDSEPAPVHPNVKKLISDLKSGKLKDPRLISFDVREGAYGARANGVTLEFANLKITNNPKKLFHWTKTQNVDKILKQGLVPSGGDWSIGSDGKAIYKAVFMLKKASALPKNHGFSHYKKPQYTLLEIDTSGLKLYVDPAHFNPDPVSFISFEIVPASQVKVK